MENLLSTSPPMQKQQQQQHPIKVPSIFSPDWNEKPNSLPSLGASNGNGNNGNVANNGAENSSSKSVAVANSPRKRVIPTNDMPQIKKEKRNDALSIPTPLHQQHQQQQRLNNSSKRDVSMPSAMQYDTSLPQNILDSKSSSSLKRQYDSIVPGENIDYRDTKVLKMEQFSPLANEPSKNYSSGINYDDSKSKSFMSTTSLNGIETNPDLVSSLLKESLSDSSSKYTGSTLGVSVASVPSHKQQDYIQMNNYGMQQQQQQLQQQEHIRQQESRKEPLDILVSSVQNIPAHFMIFKFHK